MEIFEKARILGEAGRHDSCGPKMCEVNVKEGLGGIYHARAEHADCRIFKTLMSNACSFDCRYCGNSAGCSGKKAAYRPEELASLFDYLRKNMSVNGLFLSSGVGSDPDRTTEQMIEAVRLVRFRYRFRGYVHFKVLPGVSHELVKQASELSDRMSINIEAPNKDVLAELSTNKDQNNDIIRRQEWVSRLQLPSGQTTQMIVNGLATDREVLRMARWEYESLGLRRVYFSAFRPVKGTPLENEKAESPIRQNKLYNVDFLIREYGFSFREVCSVMDGGMLPREDPKLALAREFFDGPVDLNEASYEELIRIPGIGPGTAKRILSMAATGKIESHLELKNAGVSLKRAMPFIEISGKRQKTLGEFKKR